MRTTLFTLTLCTLTACGGNSSSSDFALPPADETSSTSQVEANIGPAGGTLSTPEASLEVPPGAVSQNTVFGLSRRDGVDLAFGATLRGGSVFRLEPVGATFDTPVLVTIPYDPTTIVAPDTPNDLIALLQDTRTGQIEQLTPRSVDTTAQTATYEVPHFSQIQNALLARVLPQFTTLSADPDTGLAPNQTTTLTLSVRNRLLQELGQIEFTLTASGSNNTFGATTLNTDANGRAQTTFTTSDGGTKTITASFNGTTIQTLDLVFGLPPVTVADTGSTDEDSVLMGTSLLANDSDPDMDALTTVAETLTSAMGASVTIASDGTYAYDPTGSMALNALPNGGSAMDTFSYQASDGNLTTPGTVTISVSGLNDAPTPLADTGAASAGATLNGSGLLSNDSDPDTSDTLSTVMESVSSSAGADVSIATDGAYSFDPTMVAAFIALPQGGTTNDTFQYQATDGTASAPATVTVTVTGVNDAPTATDDTGSTDEDTALNGSGLLTNDTDPDTGATLAAVAESVTSAMGASVVIAANGTYTYDPTSVMALNALAQGESAMDTFDYQVTDGALTDTGTVTVTVNGLNDAPTATADTGSTDEDTVLNGSGLLDNDSDPDTSDTLATVMETVTSSMGASVSIASDGTYAYDPTGSMTLQALNMGDSVMDTFSYQATDGTAADSATVTITVAGREELGLDLNGATAGLDATASFTEDGGAVTLVPDAVVVSAADVTSLALTLDSAPDGDTLAATTGGTSITATFFASTNRLQLQGSDSATNYQTVLRSVTYDSTSDAPAASRTITVDLTNGSQSTSATITLSITPTNDSPTADATSASTPEDLPVTITLTGSDPDGDSLTFAIASGPSNGSLGSISQLTPTSASVTYTPDMGFDGSDSFTFTVNDGTVTSNAATVSLTVTPRFSVQGLARFEDTNQNKVADAGDTLIVPFDGNLTGAALSDFALSVTDDLFGAGTTVADGPAAHEQTITLGNGAVLKTRQDFDPMDTDAGSPSGIDAAAMSALLRASTPTDLAPGFASSIDFGTGSESTNSVALADVDGDGDLDLVVGNFLQQNVVYLQDAMGAFSSSINFGPGNDRTESVAVADVDGDGDLDIVTANFLEQNVVYLQDAMGTFTSSVNFGPGDDNTNFTTAADVDGDGDLDLVTANNGRQNVIHLQDAMGAFSSSVDFGTGTDLTNSVAVADVDGDGDLDLVAGNSSGQNVVYLQDAMGSFSSSVNFGPVNDNTNSVAVADVDGDGDLDLVTGNLGQQNVVYLQDTMGTFSTSLNFGTGSDTTFSIAVADVDEDGDLDLVTGNSSQPNVVYLQDAMGAFSSSLSVGGNDFTTSLAVADVDADGDLDIVAGNSGGQNVVYLNSLLRETPDFTTSINFGPVIARASFVAVGDMDQDGDLDIVAAVGLHQNVVYLQDAMGSFSSSVNFGTGNEESQSVAVADVDQDGDLDIVTGNYLGQDVVYLNDGAAGFTTSVNFGGSLSLTLSVAVADMDADGDLDIVTGNDGGQNVVYLQDAMGAFSSSLNFGTGSDESFSVAVADIDADGDLDIVTANLFQQNVVYLQDAMGSFSSSVNFGTGNDATISLAVVDVDQDGDLDIVTGNLGEQNAVYLQDAMGAFSSSLNFGTGDDTTASVAAADVDADGDLDLITGNIDFQQNVVYLQDAMGSFSSSVNFGTGSDTTFSIAAADIDADGDLDIVVGNALVEDAVHLQD